MEALNHWIAAARPRTWITIFCPILIGSMQGVAYGAFAWVPFFWMVLGALSLQLIINFSNDYYDCIQGFDTQTRIGPRRMVASGKISHTKMKKAFLSLHLLFILSLLGLFSRGGWPFIWLGLIASILAICYSKEPICLSKRGLGEIFVWIFFGPVATCCAAYTYLHFIPTESLWIGSGSGFLSTAILAAANIRDIEEDRITGKRTLAARFGFNAGRVEITLCLIGALVSIALLPKCALAVILLLVPFYYLLSDLWSIKKPAESISLMPKIAKLMLYYTSFIILCLLIFSKK